MSADTVGTVKLTKFTLLSFSTSCRHCGRPLDNSFVGKVFSH